MIVLDTNVVSEPLHPRPDPGVSRWLASRADEVAVTAVTIGELFFGARQLPIGSRRSVLIESIERLLVDTRSRVLPYDESAARTYAEFRERRRSAGRPLDLADGMIAAICAVNRAGLATRNVSDFEGLGLRLINPWES